MVELSPSERLAALGALNSAIDTYRDDLASSIARRARMIVEMIDDGISREQIAKACAVPSSTVFGWMDRGRVRTPHSRPLAPPPAPPAGRPDTTAVGG